MSEPTAGITAVDTAALRSAADGVSSAGACLSAGVAAYNDIPIETLSLVLGPIGGDFLAAFDAATQRHRDVVSHAGRVLDASGELMRASANALDMVDESGAESIASAGGFEV